MSAYLDTSLLVAAFVSETKTEAVQRWLSEIARLDFRISDWVLTEFASALSIKLRTGALSLTERDHVQTLLDNAVRSGLVVLAVERKFFAEAASFCVNAAYGLRSGDALHLAIAAHHGATLCTLDRRFAEAARLIGVPVTLL